MQKIVLFVQPNDGFMTPEMIGNMFINRFAIDEDVSSEILGIFELGKTSRDISWTFEQQGMDHFIVKKNKLYYTIYF